MCTWVAQRFDIPLTIIRICSTYGPQGGAPADRLEMMLAHKPIRLHPDKPNNYNPIYEDDYVELGIRAMEVADTPPIVVNWAGSETVSVEDYCTYMGELVGVEPVFEYTPDAHTPLWPDVTHMHEVLGRTKVPWRDGFRRMIAARHPEIRSAPSRFDIAEGILMQLPGSPRTTSPKSSRPVRGDITTLFVSMATRHPDGTDAEYLRWHTLDHRPEQHRLIGRTCVAEIGVDAGLPVPHVPRAPAAIDAIDHVMTYFFSDLGGMKGFLELSRALGDAGRKLPLLPPVERGVYDGRSKDSRCRGSRSVPTCCRGGRPEGCTCCWRPRVGAATAGRRRWRRGCLVCHVAAGRRQIGERACGPDDLVLLPRRRPRRSRLNDCARAFETRWSDQGIDTALRRAVSHRRAL